jgi:hypothetical protein
MLAELLRDPSIMQPLAAEEKTRLLRAVQHHVETPRETERQAAVADGRSVRAALAAAEPCDTVLGAFEALVKAEPGQVAKPVTPGADTRRPRWAAWLTLSAAVVLLLALMGVLVWSLGRGEKRELAAARPAAPAIAASRPPEQGRLAADLQAAPAVKPKPTAAVEAPPSGSPGGESPAPQADAPADRSAPVEPAAATVKQTAKAEPPPAIAAGGERPAVVAPAPAAVPAASPAGIPLIEQPRVPQGDALAIAAAPPVVPAVASPVTPSGAPAQPPQPSAPAAAAVLAPPTSVAAAATTGILLDRGLLLRRDAANPEQGGFQAVAVGGDISPGEDLLAPAAGRAVISVGGVQVELEPHTRAAVTRDADGTPRLELIFGRATARSPEAHARLGITAGGLTGVITAGLRATAGVELLLALDPGADPATTEARTTARVITGSSALAWQQTQADGTPASEPLQGIAPQGMLDPASALVWDSRDPGGVMVQRRSAADWVPGRDRNDRVEAAAAQALAAAVAKGPSVTESLRGLGGDSRAENRTAAAATLALMGDYGPLVELLCAESGALGLKHDAWIRLEQATVPLALARGAKSASRLQQAIAAKLPGDKAAEVFALARGISPAMLEADGGQRLVAGLEDEQLVVRRYAFKTLVDVVQPKASERLEYRPDRPAEQRREGVAWWRRQLADGRIRHAPARGDSGAPPAE